MAKRRKPKEIKILNVTRGDRDIRDKLALDFVIWLKKEEGIDLSIEYVKSRLKVDSKNEEK